MNMKLLHISCSPSGNESESYGLGQAVIASLYARNPAMRLVERTLGTDPLPHIAGHFALARSAASDYSELLVQELEDADTVVISTPMHNLTVPAVLKAWIDNVVRAGRTFHVTPNGKVGTLRDRPTFISVASGGKFTGDRARQPDFLTPYLKAVLATIGLHDLTFFTIQGTGLGAQALADARKEAAEAIRQHFSSHVLAVPFGRAVNALDEAAIQDSANVALLGQ
jgi:FMN-dependent NADH-azoreductase